MICSKIEQIQSLLTTLLYHYGIAIYKYDLDI